MSNDEREIYPFNLLPFDPSEEVKDAERWLRRRPFSEHDRKLKSEAEYFDPPKPLTTAMNTAIAVGEPLLLTGEPGTGKTQAAYYAARKLNTELFHFQVKSESVARDLLYHFNTVQYFHDAHMQKIRSAGKRLEKRRYVERRDLWDAFEYGVRHDKPAVLLIDEIDKAPRDFPNDLLHELDQMEFTVTETRHRVDVEHRLRPIVFITSNSERRLPEPFLRRCVYHHIRFDASALRSAVKRRREQFSKALDDGIVELAIERFLELRKNPQLRKPPSTGEMLVWLRVIDLALNEESEDVVKRLEEANPSKLPALGTLLKDHRDLEEFRES